MLGIEPRAAKYGSKHANHFAMLPTQFSDIIFFVLHQLGLESWPLDLSSNSQKCYFSPSRARVGSRTNFNRQALY